MADFNFTTATTITSTIYEAGGTSFIPSFILSGTTNLMSIWTSEEEEKFKEQQRLYMEKRKWIEDHVFHREILFEKTKKPIPWSTLSGGTIYSGSTNLTQLLGYDFVAGSGLTLTGGTLTQGTTIGISSRGMGEVVYV